MRRIALENYEAVRQACMHGIIHGEAVSHVTKTMEAHVRNETNDPVDTILLSER